MAYRSPSLKKILDSWPGKKTLGIYRFLPLFFALGAALEFSMINWHVGEVNFYRTFKKRKAEEIAEARELQKYMPLPPAVAAVLQAQSQGGSSSSSSS